MSKRLEGKVAFIAGASAGIGRATAKRMAEEGAVVIAAARNAAQLKALAAEGAAEGLNITPRVLDVSDVDAYAAALHDVAKSQGRLDILVHNAMSGRFKPFVDTTLTEWREDALVNSDASFVATREAIRIMQPFKRGSIVNIATVGALRSMPGLASYATSKAALIRMSISAAIEAAADNIRVNVVVPGMIGTESMRASFNNDPQTEKEWIATIPMARFGKPQELANAVVFLASDEASYITGVTLIVDGGKLARL
jgi:meso-butanediol dehydrogenase / (S,S)-butanediol dehydrogenase / diacetyl reductase